MKLTTTTEPAASTSADAVVVGHFQEPAFDGAAAELDQAVGGALTRLREANEITGKHGELTTVLAPTGINAGRIVVVGLGKQESFDRKAAFRAFGAATKALATKQREAVVFYADSSWDSPIAEAAATASVVSSHGQDLYRAEKKLFPFNAVSWNGIGDQDLQSAQALGDGVLLTRKLVNEPASEIYPATFAAAAEDVARATHLSLEVWDEQRLEAERCGSLLAVARGSARPPRLVILKHSGGDADAPTLAFVGKGVTFDSGGLSLKPSDGMKTMKCDMAGAATVLGAMQAVAQLDLPVNVIGLVGLVENMVSGDSYKLGDVLTARSGKTIEVLNTDAEGRLVLADVLDVAIERGATKIIDLATLTGACLVALGMDVAGLMSNDQSWCDAVADAAATAGEPAWQLPMFADYGELIKSNVADIKNIGEGRWGGAITAAKFLEEFVQETPWVHIDIAGPAFLDSAKSWIDAGGSGAFVRTLVEVARNWK